MGGEKKVRIQMGNNKFIVTSVISGVKKAGPCSHILGFRYFNELQKGEKKETGPPSEKGLKAVDI